MKASLIRIKLALAFWYELERKVKRSIGLLVLFLLPTVLLAQSPRSATGGQATIWGGGELSFYNPDWGCASNLPFDCSHQLLGPTAYFDFD